MKWKRNSTLIVFVLAVLAFAIWLNGRRDEPRRNAVAVLKTLDAALGSGDGKALLSVVVLPQAIQGRTAPEQTEFLRKALSDEISCQGLELIKRESQFGPLTNIFPAEGGEWASRAGVAPENCVAFRLEKNGTRAEVVLVCEGQHFRVVRCNNVKQMCREGSQQ